jgi:hypothetical protein
MKGYNIHMLARRAPSSIAYQYNLRFASTTTTKNKGHMILIPTLLAQRAHEKGCGLVHVYTGRRNSFNIRYENLEPEFLQCLRLYNTTVVGSARFNTFKNLTYKGLRMGTHHNYVLNFCHYYMIRTHKHT